jgi:hypothetical protein
MPDLLTRLLLQVNYLWNMRNVYRTTLFVLSGWVVILEPQGLMAQGSWRRSYGGLGTEAANQVAVTPDDGYLVTGTSGSFGNGASDMYLLRLDETGEVLWSRTYGTVAVDQGKAVAALPEGAALAGTSALGSIGGYDLLLVRVDGDGDVLWQRNYGTPDWDLCNGMIPLEDGFLMVGISYGEGTPEGQAFLVRTDVNGELVWTARTDEPLGATCNAAAVSASGQIVVAGAAVMPNGDTDRYLAAFDADGVFLWDRTLPGDSIDEFNDVLITADDRIVAIGTSYSYGPVAVINVHATDLSGTELWDRTIGNSADAGGTGITVAHGGGFVITGYNTLNMGEPDMIYTKLDNDGYWLEGNNFGNGDPALGVDVQATTDGGYVVAGWIEGVGPGARSVYVVKTNGNGQTEGLTVTTYLDPINVEEAAAEQSRLFPTLIPVNSTFVSTPSLPVTGVFSITDLSGRILHLEQVASGTTQLRTPQLCAGVYVFILEGTTERWVQRVLCDVLSP